MRLIVTLFVVRSRLIRAQVLLFAQFKPDYCTVKKITVINFCLLDDKEAVLTKKMAIM